jgi:hypothetical protein
MTHRSFGMPFSFVSATDYHKHAQSDHDCGPEDRGTACCDWYPTDFLGEPEESNQCQDDPDEIVPVPVLCVTFDVLAQSFFRHIIHLLSFSY